MSGASTSARRLPDGRINLPEVTLVAVSSLAIAQTVRALRESMRGLRFARVMMLTDESQQTELCDMIEFVPITRIDTIHAYSQFMLNDLVRFVETPFALCVQWDGYVLNSDNWQDAFLHYDYIGAPWPHFGGELVVGNGGFSLRSRRLLQATADARLDPTIGEDVAIGIVGKSRLEDEFGVRFAPSKLALAFAYERTAPRSDTLGFHGVFNMPDLDAFRDGMFLDFYRSLPRGLVRRIENVDLLRWAISQRSPTAVAMFATVLLRQGNILRSLLSLVKLVLLPKQRATV